MRDTGPDQRQEPRPRHTTSSPRAHARTGRPARQHHARSAGGARWLGHAVRTLPPVPNAEPRRRSGHDRQLHLVLQDRAPAFAPADPDDWTRDAEPVPRQPPNGYQPELFPRSPAGGAHA